eukprot:SAG22_NODE_3254_length_1827_cov_1.387731_2_plen_111_part_00
MEVGLSYLAGENPGLLSDGAELQLLILPLKKQTIDGSVDPEAEGQVRTKALPFCCAPTVFLSKTVPFHAVHLARQVFLQEEYWPDFKGQDSVLELNELRIIQTALVQIKL